MSQSITKYHAKYYAHLLTQKAIGDGINSLSQSLLSASVDINPHQIEAALFAFKSPLSKGVVLADEVGLGKTIEAGLVLCQYWAVGKRKIIVICPAALRKQWSFELTDKFGIANEILDTKNFNEYLRQGKNPLAQKRVVICSYNFVARHREEIRLHNYEIAVIDEAHKLRNVYRNSAKTANAVKDAINEVMVSDDCRLFAMMDGCVYNKNLTKMVFESRSADHIYHHKLDELWGGMIVAGENMTSLYSDDCECGMDASGFLFAYDKYKEAQKLVIDTFGDEARIDQESDEAMDAACAAFRAQNHIPADMIELVRGFVKQMVRFFNRSARRHVS